MVGTIPQDAAACASPQVAAQAGLVRADAVSASYSAASGVLPKQLWQLLIGAAFVAMLTSSLGYALWYRAEQGLTRMEGDIAVAVQAETLQQRLRLPAVDEHTSIEAVEFLSGTAMARVVVTQTVGSGSVVVRRDTRFFLQTPKGWQQTDPIAAFWGERQTLATRHLRFVFGARDRAAIAEVVPKAEAFYVALLRIADPQQALAEPGSADLLTIEFLPERVLGSGRVTLGSLQLTSPLLYRPDVAQLRTEILASMLRQFIIQYVLDLDAPLPPPKPQWDFMASGLRYWLLTGDNLPLPPHAKHDMRNAAASTRSVHLADLSQAGACAPQSCSYLQTPPRFAVEQLNSDRWPESNSLSSWQEAATLLDFVSTEYSLDAVGSLVQGFARYDNWETLAPAALGISARELENGWLGQAAAPDE